jgi:hypothetical protein
MLGLPQSFLRDRGVDALWLDSLPEDMQIEELNLLMQNPQNAPPNRQNTQATETQI